jgi:hypothetical protein
MKPMSINQAIKLIDRDHGGCDQHTCTISMAMRNGYHLIAIDSWIGSGAASEEFDGRELPFSFADVQRECALMTRELEHIQCVHCDAVIWLPDDCGYWCDNCGKQNEVAS